MADDLAAEVKALEQTCQEHAITVIPGTFEREGMPTVNWETPAPNDLTIYFNLVKSVSNPLVVLEKYEFDEEAFEELRTGNSEADDDTSVLTGEEETADRELLEELDTLRTKYSRFYGSLHTYTLNWIKDGVCYTYEREADWYGELIADLQELNDKLEAALAEDESEEEVPELTKVEIGNFASELARDELFQRATNQASRRFAFQRRHPDIAENHPREIPEIIDQAKGIFELEIKPEQEESLDQQITDLSNQGLNKEQIARKLRISVTRVRKVV